MFPVDSAAAAQAARNSVGAVGGATVAHGKRMGVDLTKRYLGGLDVAYSSAMTRMPRVPKFNISEVFNVEDFDD